jgi:DNA-binding NarL/FixJ family response regulator
VSLRLVIADDEAMVRSGLSLVLEAEDDFDVVAEAADGEEAITQTRRHRPDVLLMDIRIPRLDGIAAAERLVEEDLPTRVLLLTTFDHDDYLFRALRAGTSGFLLKSAPAEDLVRAVRTVAAGDALLAPAVTRPVIAEFAERPAARRTPPRELDELTSREREVLVLLARGLTNAEIAERLIVSDATIKTHVARVLMKLGVRDRVQAVIFAYEAGVITAGAHDA